jgi:hypothetical protein
VRARDIYRFLFGQRQCKGQERRARRGSQGVSGQDGGVLVAVAPRVPGAAARMNRVIHGLRGRMG